MCCPPLTVPRACSSVDYRPRSVQLHGWQRQMLATAGEKTASVSFPTLSGRKPELTVVTICVVVVAVFIDVATYLHLLLRLVSMLWCTEHSVYTLCTL